MNSSIWSRVLIGLAVLVVVVVGYSWLAGDDYEERRVFDPENRQLAIERMHIAERWLATQSRPVDVVQTLQFLETLPAAGHHLITTSALGEMSLLDASQLQDWVLRGGHLIAVAPTELPTDQQAFDLNPFGVTNCFECLQTSDHSNEAAQTKDPARDEEDAIGRVRIKGLADRPLRLWSQLALSVDKPSDKLEQWVSAQGMPMVVRYAFGAGKITILPANQWLDNAQMIEPDHARLLTALVADRSGTVYLQHYSIPGGLLTWLWQLAPAFWMALLALIALWIWYRLPRLGPIQPDPDTATNQLRDRLRANARFDSRHNHGRRLLDALRDEIALKALRRYPDWRQLTPTQRSQRLSHLCAELGPDQIHGFLTRERIDPADRLIDDLAVQRKLLKAL